MMWYTHSLFIRDTSYCEMKQPFEGVCIGNILRLLAILCYKFYKEYYYNYVPYYLQIIPDSQYVVHIHEITVLTACRTGIPNILPMHACSYLTSRHAWDRARYKYKLL